MIGVYLAIAFACEPSVSRQAVASACEGPVIGFRGLAATLTSRFSVSSLCAAGMSQLSRPSHLAAVCSLRWRRLPAAE